MYKFISKKLFTMCVTVLFKKNLKFFRGLHENDNKIIYNFEAKY